MPISMAQAKILTAELSRLPPPRETDRCVLPCATTVPESRAIHAPPFRKESACPTSPNDCGSITATSIDCTLSIDRLPTVADWRSPLKSLRALVIDDEPPA